MEFWIFKPARSGFHSGFQRFDASVEFDRF